MTAIRAVGSYLKEHNAVVSAFYLSNVEQYLGQNGVEDVFLFNVAQLPLDESSTFIRSVRSPSSPLSTGLISELGVMKDETKSCK